jgi:hypothetical protein
VTPPPSFLSFRELTHHLLRGRQKGSPVSSVYTQPAPPVPAMVHPCYTSQPSYTPLLHPAADPTTTLLHPAATPLIRSWTVYLKRLPAT